MTELEQLRWNTEKAYLTAFNAMWELVDAITAERETIMRNCVSRKRKIMNKQVEQIKAEVERLWRMCMRYDHVDAVAIDVLNRLKDYINSLQEEPISEDLEEAARRHAEERFRTTRDSQLAMKCKWSFISGAKWYYEMEHGEV